MKYVVIGAVALVGLILWFGYKEIVQLHTMNEQLTIALEDTKATLDAELSRSKRVEESLQRLETNDVQRQTQLRQFEGRLGTLAKSNQQIQSVLATVVPADVLSGLRSFPPSGQN